MAEINVTPLVDVMLVLLIIFMVTAPMMTRGVKVNLPETTAKELTQKKEHITITVNSNGEIFMEDMIYHPDVLSIRLKSMHETDSISQILLKADQNVQYGKVAEVMAIIKESGISGIGLVTRPSDKIKD